jgi:sugar lactone lactonase YvrE
MKKNLLISLIALSVSSTAQVATFAGKSGEIGFDDQQGSNVTNTRFWTPWGLAFDSKSNLWVTDFGAHRIKMISSDLTNVYTRSGPIGSDPTQSGGYSDQYGSQAAYNGPTGIAVDANDNVIILDLYNSCIRKLEKFVTLGSSQGVTTIAGVQGSSGSADGTALSATFNNAIDIVIASNGDMYIADRDNHCIRKISGGNVTTFAGTAGTAGFSDATGTSAKFAGPSGICFDNKGDLLVADMINHRIRRVNVATSPAGKVTTVAGKDGNAVTDGAIADAEFLSPIDVACDAKGNIYVSEHNYANIIRRIANGKVTTIAGKVGVTGKQDGALSSSTFNGPMSILLDKTGTKLYVADSGNYSIRTINLSKLSVETFEDSRVSIYPNPAANGFFTVENNDPEFKINHVNIFSNDGKNVYTMQVAKTGAMQVDVSQLPAGMYIVQLTDGERIINARWVIR